MEAIFMTMREIAIAKLHQLPESLLQEVTDFIDFVTYKHQSKIANGEFQHDIAEAWTQWFESVDQLDVIAEETEITCQQLLLDKYRQQGLEL
jgi:hypothetical protein